jgi:hypothetical protein
MSGDTSYVYVYCVSAPEAVPALAGLDGVEPGAAPYAIESRGLVAVASDVPADRYGQEALRQRLADLAWAGARGIAHERVVETAFLAAPTVPFRFCTLFETRARVVGLIERYEARLQEILRELAGKAECGLSAYVDRARFDAWAAAEAAKAAPARPGVGSGRAYLEAKKAAQDARRAAGEALSRVLSEVYAVHDAAALRAVRQPAGDQGELALKAAFLVPLAAREEFEAVAAAERARREPQGIRLRLTGPWPPYAFVPRLED